MFKKVWEAIVNYFSEDYIFDAKGVEALGDELLLASKTVSPLKNRY